MTEDERNDLVKRLRQYIEEYAARLKPSDERAELLRCLDDSIQIFRSYEGLARWVNSVTTIDRDGTHRIHDAELRHGSEGEFLFAGGIVYLLGAVWAALNVGGHALSEPALKEELKRYRKSIPAKATERRKEKSALRGGLIRQLYGEGMPPKDIPTELANRGVFANPRTKKKVSQSTVYRLLRKGDDGSQH